MNIFYGESLTTTRDQLLTTKRGPETSWADILVWTISGQDLHRTSTRPGQNKNYTRPGQNKNYTILSQVLTKTRIRQERTFLCQNKQQTSLSVPIPVQKLTVVSFHRQPHCSNTGNVSKLPKLQQQGQYAPSVKCRDCFNRRVICNT